jgi:hypothetical protein
MVGTRQSIFRDKAVKHYNQGRKKDVLPNFSSIPAAIFAWALLASLIVTGLVASLGQVPVFLPGSGIVLGSGSASSATNANSGVSALAFFPPEQLAKLQPGQKVQLLVGASSSQVSGTVAQVLPAPTNLAAALTQYGLNVGSGSSLSSQKFAVALIKLGTSASLDPGSTGVVQVSVGTQSLFSALTGITF